MLILPNKEIQFKIILRYCFMLLNFFLKDFFDNKNNVCWQSWSKPSIQLLL